MTESETQGVLIRADAGGILGSGHVMRMVALGQALQRRNIAVTIASIQCPPSISRHIKKAGFNFEILEAAPLGGHKDSRMTTRLARRLTCRWIILDGYHFGYEFQKFVHEAGYRTAVMDDFQHIDRWFADLIVNQNIGTEGTAYPNDLPPGKALCGGCFALLREEFRMVADTEDPKTDNSRNLLITMGGVDPGNVSGTLLRALELIDNHKLEIKVIVGGDNPHKEELRQLATASRHKIDLEENVSDMPALYQWSDRVISGGGSSCYEWLYFSRKAAVVELAENQRPIINALKEKKLAMHLGKFGEFDAEQVAHRLRQWFNDESKPDIPRIIDGKGADRVAAAISGRLSITIASDEKSWINRYISEAISNGAFGGHDVELVHDLKRASPGDLLFLLSYWSIVPRNILNRYTHGLVVHASDLPQGRGWSPVSWQILEGRNDIPFSLLEAHHRVDSGPLYMQRIMHLEGNELLPDIHRRQAEISIEMCASFAEEYPGIISSSRPQSGEPSYYPRRSPSDSEVDATKTLADQFNLLRIVDNENYPAFFSHKGRTFVLKIEPASGKDQLDNRR